MMSVHLQQFCSFTLISYLKMEFIYAAIKNVFTFCILIVIIKRNTEQPCGALMVERWLCIREVQGSILEAAILTEVLTGKCRNHTFLQDYSQVHSYHLNCVLCFY